MTKQILQWLTAFFSLLAPAASGAYDNSRFPPFDTAIEGRGFQDISIHPNEEEWLISECSKVITNFPSCHLFIYSLKDKTYRRLNLSRAYSYINGKFSPNGKQILAVRQPPPKSNHYDEVLKSYAQGEIFIMNRDGSDFRVLPIPANRIMNPVMSPDGTKIAYLIAESDKPYVSSVSFAYFEIWEHDLMSGENRLFAGPMRFYHATMINYLSDSEIIAGALAPEFTGEGQSRDYLGKYQGSEVFKIKRQMRFAPEPSFYDLPFARYPSTDIRGNVFFEAQPEKIGFSLVMRTATGSTKIWRAPQKNFCVASKYISAASGNYVAFIYGGDSLTSAEGKRALGYFDVQNETWHSISPPKINQDLLHK